MNEIIEYTENVFEDIKHIDEEGNEYQLARELQHVLDYSQWRRFEGVIDKAKISCKNSYLMLMNNLPMLASCLKDQIMPLQKYLITNYQDMHVI